MAYTFSYFFFFEKFNRNYFKTDITQIGIPNFMGVCFKTLTCILFIHICNQNMKYINNIAYEKEISFLSAMMKYS
ncbi:hypothetical protein [Plasmodium yoelii yoelii]|uniref:Uncharacterized protein n=1 Tax=Plasmodium yoelii yoelii TaxID=73239 RepID=Q7RDT2_PLAYO|nr:hypothetical protein [Plasmodium yoelii yoelii]